MNLICYLYRQSSKLLLLATLAGMIAGLSGAAVIAIISKGIGDAGPHLALAWMFFGACLVYLISKSYSEISLLHLTQSAIFDLRISLSQKLLATPLKRLQALGKPGLLVILTKDIDTFIQASQLLPLAFGNSIIVVACLSYIAWLSWQVFIMFTVCLLICLFGFHVAERRPLGQLVKVREHMDILYQNFRNLIEGSKELQLNTQRGAMFIKQIITPGALNFKYAFIRSMASYTWVINIGTILFYLIIGILVFVIPLWLPQRVGILITITLILLYLIRPISEIMTVLPPLRQAAIALEKIQQLDTELIAIEPIELTADPFISQAPLLLELQGICHHYPAATEDSQFMLGPLNLTIHQGEIVFIVGGNGSGKTTLAMLLLGLYEPEMGSIVLNGTSVNEANLDKYRQYFSAVFSDFHLFEQLLGTDRHDLSVQATRYVEILNMAHKVKVVDGKFSTINLSTGQRKRLALVSSYLEDRPIYLFDEWAADQDPVFKRIFYTELLPDLKVRGKTILVITHDDAYFSCADRIIKLEDGHLQPHYSAEV